MSDIDRKNPVDPENEPVDDEIIDLTRVVRKGDDPDTGDPAFDEARHFPNPEIEPEFELDDFDEDDLDLGQLVAEVTGVDASVSSESVTIPLKQLENVLEKLLQKAYSDKIEVMVMNMIEKTLKAEIEKINALIWKIAHENEGESEDS